MSHCKKCQVAKYKQSVKLRAHRDRLYMQGIKLERGCTDCGYNAHPAALDFDHLPGTVKRYRLCTMYGMKRELIDAEIAKCEVVCANCHRVRTADRRPPLTVDLTYLPSRRKGFEYANEG